MTHEVLAALPHSEAEAKSLKDIAQVIGLDISTHMDWIRAERSLARVLRILINWEWASRDRKQRIVIDSGIMSTGRRNWQSSRNLPKGINRTIKSNMFCRQWR